MGPPVAINNIVTEPAFTRCAIIRGRRLVIKEIKKRGYGTQSASSEPAGPGVYLDDSIMLVIGVPHNAMIFTVQFAKQIRGVSGVGTQVQP